MPPRKVASEPIDTSSFYNEGDNMPGPLALAGAQVFQSAMNIYAQHKAQKAAEKEGKANRKLSRQEMAIELMMDAARIQSQNKYDMNRAEQMAPRLQMRTQERFGPSAGAESRANAMGRQEGTSPEVSSLVNNSFETFRQQRDQGRQMASQITPEKLAPQQVDPAQLLGEKSPGTYQDVMGLQKFSNKSGDGLDDIEVQMLNKRVVEGATPEEISKLLKHFRTPGVEGGK